MVGNGLSARNRFELYFLWSGKGRIYAMTRYWGIEIPCAGPGDLFSPGQNGEPRVWEKVLKSGRGSPVLSVQSQPGGQPALIQRYQPLIEQLMAVLGHIIEEKVILFQVTFLQGIGDLV